MSKTAEAPTQNRVIDLKSGAHMMVLDAGIFCIFHAAGQPDPGPAGLPGVRISRAPGTPPGIVTVSTFEEDGWIGGANGAALVRITRGPAAVLVTTYQEPGSPHDAPKIQVAQLAGPTSVSPASVAVAQPAQKAADLSAAPAEISAHVQRVGDVAAPIGEWMGTPGSQSWIEGFAIAPKNSIPASDIEYQAVLGKGWLSPWSEGGQYCGSRGMALPILGLRVRLKGASAETHHIRLSSTFTDGSRLGPLDGTDALEAESLAPLEAFLLEIIPNEAAEAPAAKSAKTSRAKSTKAPAKRKSASAD
ncbi:Clostridial hydrophobic W [Gluconobacter japonicus]|nr:Clostridial hydrophobic W [Gluconobacter japonicus]